MGVKASTSITLSAVVDVASCTRYYLLQSSTLSPPAKPTTKPPTGSWNDTEPTYTSGSTNSLYFCDLTVFSDGTWSYSSVSRSSSYEAAKEAYNRAIAAGQSASDALTAAQQAASSVGVLEDKVISKGIQLITNGRRTTGRRSTPRRKRPRTRRTLRTGRRKQPRMRRTARTRTRGRSSCWTGMCAVYLLSSMSGTAALKR